MQRKWMVALVVFAGAGLSLASLMMRERLARSEGEISIAESAKISLRSESAPASWPPSLSRPESLHADPLAGRTQRGGIETTVRDGGVDRNVTLAELERDWSDEPPDPSWTAARTEFLQSMLSDLEIAGVVAEVSCRATLCKARLELDTSSELVKLAEGAGDAPTERWVDVRMEAEKALVDVFVRREELSP